MSDRTTNTERKGVPLGVFARGGPDDEPECGPDDNWLLGVGMSAQGERPLDLILHEIRNFRTHGTEKDRLAFTAPYVVNAALEQIFSLGGRFAHVNVAAQWALHCGLERLEAIPEVQTICGAYEAVMKARGDAIAHFRWSHRIGGHGETKRIWLRSVSPSDSAKCARLGRQLGLGEGFAAIGVAAGLVGLPLPGPYIPSALLRELREFRRQLKQRVPLAEELQKQALASLTAPEPRITWSDVLAD